MLVSSTRMFRQQQFHRVPAVLSAVLLTLLTAHAATLPPNVNFLAGPNEAQCSGGFDLYFVLDRSGSVTNENFQRQTVDFVETLLQSFTSSKMRVSFVTFSSRDSSSVIMRLTRNRNVIEAGIKDLRQLGTSGGTYLQKGLELANQQIRESDDGTASVIITLTDGILDDRIEAAKEAEISRSLGAKILAVRVGESSVRDLQKVADPPAKEHIFRGDTFDDLQSIIIQIVNTSCIEILSASPTSICAGEAFNVSITGNGFTKTDDISKVICNFRLNDTDNQEVHPITVSSSYLLCPAPKIATPGSFVVLQVSVNGISFISSNVTIMARDCTQPDVTGAVLGVLLTFLILGLLALWWFWNILCCVVVKAPPSPPPQEPESPSGKKWPAVNASVYGGGGIGGMKPVTVRWGDKGCTEGGSHLEKAKDAKVVKEVDETPAAMRHGAPGCMDNFKKALTACFTPVKSLYDRISVMRPAPGQKGCCCRVENGPVRI
ncbi:anthrax toxin receptor 1-like [Acanthaster planci]|uniref:Anthrax toxin receptor 1-like n=1 Tax=Acanthaster planci TaxID=133434 RepID=A0A8B8A2B9_ACAPL|nr:anthrax toxin receptor 1-like [Acanthaster planci]